jgi:hypothetical protein
MPGSSTAACAKAGVAIATDRIIAALKRLKLVMVDSLRVSAPVRVMRRPLTEKSRMCLLIFLGARNREVAAKPSSSLRKHLMPSAPLVHGQRPVFCMLLEPNEWWVVREYTIASNNIHFWMGIKPARRLGLRGTVG